MVQCRSIATGPTWLLVRSYGRPDAARAGAGQQGGAHDGGRTQFALQSRYYLLSVPCVSVGGRTAWKNCDERSARSSDRDGLTSLHLGRSYELRSRHFMLSCRAISHGSANCVGEPRPRRTSTYGTGVAPVGGGSTSVLGGGRDDGGIGADMSREIKR